MKADERIAAAMNTWRAAEEASEASWKETLPAILSALEENGGYVTTRPKLAPDGHSYVTTYFLHRRDEVTSYSYGVGRVGDGTLAEPIPHLPDVGDRCFALHLSNDAARQAVSDAKIEVTRLLVEKLGDAAKGIDEEAIALVAKALWGTQ